MPSTPRSEDERPESSDSDTPEATAATTNGSGTNGHVAYGASGVLKRPLPPIMGLGRDPATLDAWLARIEAEGTDLR